MKADVCGLNEKLIGILTEKKLKISTAESCTGGLLSALLTDVSGASEVLEECIVTYSNAVKMRELNVKEETLRNYGAVSFDTAKQMAEGICAHTGADVGIGITGIAGPSGGTAEKPVGTVFIGVSVLQETVVLENHFHGSRESVREQSCITALKAAIELTEKANVQKSVQ